MANAQFSSHLVAPDLMPQNPDSWSCSNTEPSSTSEEAELSSK